MEGQERLHPVDGPRVRGQERGEPPGAHHQRGVAPLLPDPADDPVDGLHGAEEDAALERRVGAAADDRGRRLDVHAGQPGGAARERLGARSHARGDDAAEEDAVGGDAVEGGGGAEVDHDGVRSVEASGGQRVGDAVGAHAEWLLDVQADGQVTGGADDEGITVQVPLAGLGQRLGQGRDDGRDGRARDPAPIQPALPEHRSQEQAVLVGGAFGSGGQPPVRRQLLAVEDAQHGLGVADVQGQDHRSPPGSGWNGRTVPPTT